MSKLSEYIMEIQRNAVADAKEQRDVFFSCPELKGSSNDSLLHNLYLDSYKNTLSENDVKDVIPDNAGGNEVPESNDNICASVEDHLDFADGTSFHFRFVPIDNGRYWEVDLLKQPDYGEMPCDAHSTHREYSEREGCEYKIDFTVTDPTVVNSKEKAKMYAKAWAEKTWAYIFNGDLF